MPITKVDIEKRRKEVRDALMLGPITVRQILDASHEFTGKDAVANYVDRFRAKSQAHIHGYVKVHGGRGWAAQFIWGKGDDAPMPLLDENPEEIEYLSKWAEGREKKKKAVVKVQRCEFETYFFGPAKTSKKGRQTEP